MADQRSKMKPKEPSGSSRLHRADFWKDVTKGDLCSKGVCEEGVWIIPEQWHQKTPSLVLAGWGFQSFSNPIKWISHCPKGNGGSEWNPPATQNIQNTGKNQKTLNASCYPRNPKHLLEGPKSLSQPAAALLSSPVLLSNQDVFCPLLKPRTVWALKKGPADENVESQQKTCLT